MLLVISPAKSLDFESPLPTQQHTQSDFLEQSQTLINQARELSPAQIGSMMKISDKLAELNHQRFHSWETPFTHDNARAAAFAFKGDVYQGMEAETFSDADYKFAQQHLRILSGLYGLLRPLDLIQPYRLEMGTRFENSAGKNLYHFWGTQITDALNQQIAASNSQVLLNLASTEYFTAVKPKLVKADIITPVFKDQKNGQYKIISFWAKRARGLMASYVIRNQITDPSKLVEFDTDGYYYSEAESTDKQMVFLRDHLPA
jgi:cytoplasmic iron level regulating protein YaaA (DUF328/UPF0246 family)